MKTPLLLSLATVLTIAAVASAATLANKVNLTLGGHALSLDSVQVNGQTYVSLAELKAQMAAEGGANGLSATEGPMGHLLFNGVWRFRVTGVAWNADRTCWDVTVELRNGTQTTRSVGGNGTSDYPNLAFSVATEAGDTLRQDGGWDVPTMNALTTKALSPGAGAITTLHFSGKQDDKPVKFIYEFHAKAGLPFSKDPSFRVDLTKSAP